LRVALLVLFCGAIPAALRAEDSLTYAAARTRAAFLARSSGARASAMGGAFSAVADDASAGSWNPAGLGQIATVDAMAVFDSPGEGMMTGYLAGALRTGPGTVGVQVTAAGYGTYTSRDVEGRNLGDLTAPQDIAAGLSWASRLPVPGNPLFGVSAEMVREGTGGTVPGASAGLLVRAGKDVALGLAARHLGPSKDGFSLPAVVQGGAAWHPRDRLQVSLDGAYGLTDRLAQIAVGAEFEPHRVFVLRAGYSHMLENQELEGLTGLTAGLGFRFRGWGLDYAFQPFGELAVIHRVGLVFRPSSIWPGRALMGR